MAFYGDGKHNENMEHVSPTLREFVFNLDQKVTTWMRTEFTIEAENLTEAKELAIKFHLDGETEDIEWTQIHDTTDRMRVDENGGECTEEIYFNGLLVYTNDL